MVHDPLLPYHGSPAVFLDRDGVLNETFVIDGKAYAPRSLANFHLTPGAADAVAKLKAAGFAVVVATNQPDLANGLVAPEVVAEMHRRLTVDLAVDAIEICPHTQTDGCDCRKPRPGMLHRAATNLGIDLSRSWMVGDRWVDVAAGQGAGCATILIERPYSLIGSDGLTPSIVARDLPSAVDAILANYKKLPQP